MAVGYSVLLFPLWLCVSGGMMNNYMVDIQTLMRQLRQQIEQLEWEGKPFKHLQYEYDHIVDYYAQTGSRYYPLF